MIWRKVLCFDRLDLNWICFDTLDSSKMSSNLIVPCLLCFDRPDQKVYVLTVSIKGKICSSVFDPSVFVSTNSTLIFPFSDIEKMCLTEFDTSVLYIGRPDSNWLCFYRLDCVSIVFEPSMLSFDRLDSVRFFDRLAVRFF